MSDLGHYALRLALFVAGVGVVLGVWAGLALTIR